MGGAATRCRRRTVEYVHAVLRKAFADAVRNDQVLTSNPAERAKRPRKEQAAAVVMWTAEDLASFLKPRRRGTGCTATSGSRRTPEPGAGS